MLEKCKAKLLIGDDYGDSCATIHCQLAMNHKGLHNEVYQNKGEVVITWENDNKDHRGGDKEITKQEFIETKIAEFEKRWKNIECSAHERTSSSACICDELEDINANYGYSEIKDFLAQSLSQAMDEVKEKKI